MAMTACSVKVLQERDLLVGERPRLAAPDADRPDGRPFPEDGHAQDGSQGDGVAQRMGVLGVDRRVLEVHDALVEDRASGGRAAIDRHRIRLVKEPPRPPRSRRARPPA